MSRARVFIEQLRNPSTGSQILEGNGLPDTGIGTDGDMYIDNLTGYYFKKETGAWAKKSQLGVAKGTSAPSNPDTYDLWLDTTGI